MADVNYSVEVKNVSLNIKKDTILKDVSMKL